MISVKYVSHSTINRNSHLRFWQQSMFLWSVEDRIRDSLPFAYFDCTSPRQFHLQIYRLFDLFYANRKPQEEKPFTSHHLFITSTFNG